MSENRKVEPKKLSTKGIFPDLTRLSNKEASEFIGSIIGAIIGVIIACVVTAIIMISHASALREETLAELPYLVKSSYVSFKVDNIYDGTSGEFIYFECRLGASSTVSLLKEHFDERVGHGVSSLFKVTNSGCPELSDFVFHASLENMGGFIRSDSAHYIKSVELGKKAKSAIENLPLQSY